MNSEKKRACNDIDFFFTRSFLRKKGTIYSPILISRSYKTCCPICRFRKVPHDSVSLQSARLVVPLVISNELMFTTHSNAQNIFDKKRIHVLVR